MTATKNKFNTIAQEALIDWCDDKGFKQAEMARLLGVSRATLTHWWQGSARPEPWRRLLIEALCDIDAFDWLTDDDLDKSVGAARKVMPMVGDYLEGKELRETKHRLKELSGSVS